MTFIPNTVEIQFCYFAGTNKNGSPPLWKDNNGVNIRLIGWVCLGPANTSPMNWRFRLAWWLLKNYFANVDPGPLMVTVQPAPTPVQSPVDFRSKMN